MSQVPYLAFSVEITILISFYIVISVVLGEWWQFRVRLGVVTFLIFKFFDGAVFREVTRCGAVAVSAAILGANRFGMMGTVASMAFPGINCGERGSDWDSVGASGG